MNHQYLDAHWEAVACGDCKQPFSEKLLRARETANKLKNI
jgi:hypothetical protein